MSERHDIEESLSGEKGTKVGVINCGSSSIKYEVFDRKKRTKLATGLVERIGSAEGRMRQSRLQADGTFVEQVHMKPLADHHEAFNFMVDMNRENRIIRDDAELFCVGHRVVHGGELFREPAIVDDEVVAAIERLIPLAPLHNPSNLLGIEAARMRFHGIPQVAVFDTAFHQTLPPAAYRYALPHELYEKYQVRRYGFHGASHAFVAREAAQFLGHPMEELNLITLHLGNGASVAAIRAGECIDTSMGMTPLEGLVMGTRSGDLDPAIPFYLIRQLALTPEKVENLLNKESGLKGVCGFSDMREIQQRASEGDERAALAFDMFCYRVRKYIGAYCAVLGRLDAMIFTGGIGENSAAVRSAVCAGLRNLGISVDARKNGAVAGKAAEIQEEETAVRVLVVPTNEELEIALQAEAVIEKRMKTGQ
ncbi:acetate kinase [Geotalea uraniireducens]|uniref:Acetate kinase n=1 Tax=Geotalea uraniireducens (strain Rf4) TaxID=351605 RepID=A5G4W3_GEOUR|nr:acetate kinase [Geotalea uraniireducens]ABQ26831.1 acetate kinase [Geotalea uraniireducens Rf4]